MVHQDSLDAARAREVARSEFDAWIASAAQPEAARRSIAPDAALRSTTLARVEAVLAHPHCGAANRRWICELTRGWAPLEVLFPTRDYRGMKGVSGELPLHVALLVEREYGHILGVARNLPAAYDLLRQDRDRLSLQLSIAAALLPLLADASSEECHLARRAEADVARDVRVPASPRDWPCADPAGRAGDDLHRRDRAHTARAAYGLSGRRVIEGIEAQPILRQSRCRKRNARGFNQARRPRDPGLAPRQLAVLVQHRLVHPAETVMCR